jgi:hypothetical protein
MKARRATQYIGVTLYSPKVRDTITLNLQKVQITNEIVEKMYLQ